MIERDIFLNALERENPVERAGYLDAACAGRPALRRQVEELLRYHQEDPTFLNVPAMEQLAAAEESLTFLGPRAEPGTLGRLDHYDVLDIVGHGSTGVVLKARDAKLQRVVAVKALAARLAPSVAARKRFVREAQAAAAVRDDNVVSIYAVSDDGPVPYLVMEYISGLTLEQRLKQDKPLRLEEILRIGMQLAAGLAAAHAQGLIHRDIKPANILLENGVQRVKITDFGLARIAAEAGPIGVSSVAGTPPYMSPEQARGEPIDVRTDLFSLGSVLYTLCAAQPPFQGETTSEVLARIRDEQARPVRELNPEIPEWLCGLIGQLLAKDPAARPTSARAVADLLAGQLALLQQPPIASSHPDEPIAFVRPAQRSWRAPSLRRVIVGLCIVGALAVVTLAILLLLSPRPDPKAAGKTDTKINRSRPLEPLNLRRERISPFLMTLAGGGDPAHAPAELEAVLGDGRFLLPRVGATAWMQQSPSERLLAVPLDEDVCLFEVQTGKYLHEFTGPGGRVVWVSFSPDSRLLAASTWFQGAGGALRVWNLDSDKELFTVKVPGRKISGVTAFSPDGKRLVGETAQGLGVWDARTGEEIQAIRDLSGGCSSLCFHPDGRRLAAAHWSAKAVKTFDWDGSTLIASHTLNGHSAAVGAVLYSPDGKRLVSGAEHEFKVWDAESLREIGTIHTPASQVAVTPDSRTLYAAAAAVEETPVHTLTRWDVATLREHPPLAVEVSFQRAGIVHCLSRDGKVLFASPGLSTAYIRAIDTATGKEVFPYRGHVAPVNVVTVSPDGRTLASAGDDVVVKLWDLASGRVLHSFAQHTEAIWGLAFSADGKLASGSQDGTIAIWDVRTGSPLRVLHGHSRSPSRIQFSTDGISIVAGGEVGVINRWDVITGREQRPLTGRSGAMRGVAFSPDGRQLAWGGEDRTVSIHDLWNGHVRKFSTPSSVNDVAFSPDSQALAAVDDAADAAVHVWDLETGKETVRHGHTADVHGVAFSPDGSLLATSADDGTVRLWDWRTASPKARTIGPGPFGGPVRAVAFTPDGRYLATANANGTIYLLRVPPPVNQF